MLASFPVSTPTFFSACCEKKLGVETGNEATHTHVLCNAVMLGNTCAGNRYASCVQLPDCFLSLSFCLVGSHALELAFSLFECAGEMGDLNGLYTCAQLLRTGS